MSGARNLSASSKPMLRWLPGRKPTIFSTNFTPIHRLNTITIGIINDPSHPRHFRLKRKYEEKDRNCLWWAPQVTLAISPKRTVRSWCMRRLRAAFREELAARGLNELGQRVQGGKVLEGPAMFRGTLIIQANESLVTARYGRLREEAGWMADALLTAFKPQAGGREGLEHQKQQRPKPREREMTSRGKAPRRQQ